MLAFALPAAAPAAAAGLAFDCDVPAERYSSISQPLAGPGYAIAGNVAAAELRAGEYLPLAGIRLTTADDQPFASLRFVAATRRAKTLDVLFSHRIGGEMREAKLGTVAAGQPVSFRLALDPSGALAVAVGSSSFSFGTTPLPAAKAGAFCSTGQFKFSDLTMAAADGRGPASR